MNFELGTHDANFGFDEERVARLSLEIVWLRKTRGKMERFSVESCVGGYHVYKARTPLVLAYMNERYWSRSCLLPCSLLCSLPPSLHVGQLEKGNPTDQGHCQQGTSSEKEPNVSTCRQRCSVRVGGKFRNTGVNHENNEN